MAPPAAFVRERAGVSSTFLHENSAARVLVKNAAADSRDRNDRRVTLGGPSRPLPLNSPLREGETLSEPMARPSHEAKQTAMVRSRLSFRQAPDPDAPGPRAIEA